MMKIIEAAYNTVTTVAKQYQAAIDDLESKLADAMRFVPYPETMSGWCDPSAPDEVKELIALACKLRGRNLPEPDEPDAAPQAEKPQ
jgi:hypothetical protein